MASSDTEPSAATDGVGRASVGDRPPPEAFCAPAHFPPTGMTFVTRLTLQSGDRAKLESVVADIKERARRKGVELNGPHAEQPVELSVPRHKTATGAGRFEPWSYTVYARVLEIVGHQDYARQEAARRFPPGVHVGVEVEQREPMG